MLAIVRLGVGRIQTGSKQESIGIQSGSNRDPIGFNRSSVPFGARLIDAIVVT